MRTAYFVTALTLLLIAGSGYLIHSLAARLEEQRRITEITEFHAELAQRERCRAMWPLAGENFDLCISQSPRN